MSRRTKRRIGLFALVLALIGLGVALMLHLREPLLLDRATPIFTDWGSGPYAWQSDHRLLVFVLSGRGGQVFQVDVETGAKTVLANCGLPPATPQDNYQPSYNTVSLHVSPDGDWAAYADLYSGQLSGYTVLKLDGSGKFSWPGNVGSHYAYYGSQAQTPPAPQLVWLPDSRRWLEWTPRQSGGYLLFLHSLDAPDQAIPVAAPDQRPTPIVVPGSAQSLLGVTPDYRLILTDFFPVSSSTSSKSSQKITIWEIGIYPNMTPMRKFAVLLPSEAQAEEVTLSPQGDRLAWTLFSSRSAPWAQFLERILPARWIPPKSNAYTLWVSRTDGTEMQEIGSRPIHSPSETGSVGNVHWLPDGKRLSFRCLTRLYTVPAE